jgi:hypothetical protein
VTFFQFPDHIREAEFVVVEEHQHVIQKICRFRDNLLVTVFYL